MMHFNVIKKLYFMLSFCVINTFANITTYKWQLTILEQLPDLSYKQIGLLSIKSGLDVSSILKTASVLPLMHNEGKMDQAMHFKTSPYVVQVKVVDENQQVSDAIMRSLLEIGIQPVLHVDYLADSEFTEKGETQFEIIGALQSNETNMDDNKTISSFSWIYPLPFNEFSRSVYLEIQEITTAFFTIHSFKKPMHLVMYNFVDDGTINSPPPNDDLFVSDYGSDTFVGRWNALIFSSDEFETSFIKTIPDTSGSPIVCPNFNEFTVKIPKTLLYFSKRGFFQIHNGSFGLGVDHVTERGINICPSQVSLSRRYQTNSVLLTVENHLKVLSINSKTTVNELKDKNGSSVCNFLLLSSSDCIISTHLSGVQNCCYSYVLVQSQSINRYYFVKYNGYFMKGTWNLLKKFDANMPKNLTVFGEGFVLLDSTSRNNGTPIILSGINEMGSMGGHIYLWGNVFLYFDPLSRYLSAILTSTDPQPSATFNGSVVKQLVIERRGKRMSLLLSNGEIWHAICTSYFSTRYMSRNQKTAQDYTNTSLSNVLGLYYDSYKAVYVLAVIGSKLQRHKINLEFILHHTNDITISITCHNISMHSWRRQFIFYPPRVWPSQNTPQARSTDQLSQFTYLDSLHLTPHSNNDIYAYRVTSSLIFERERIGVEGWWKNFQEEITNNWYYDNLEFEHYLEYLSDSNLQFGLIWTSYLSQYDYHIDKKYVTPGCSIPSYVYLNKDSSVSINITIATGTTGSYILISEFEVFVTLSLGDFVKYSVVKIAKPFEATFQVTFTGLQMEQQSPGVKLLTETANIYPWIPQTNHVRHEEGVTLYIKVGCPSALTLEFDRQRSIEVLAARGRTDNFECLYDLNDGIPCFTTSEFVTVFHIKDHITGIETPFRGNFTLSVVGGGVGYVENIVNFTEEEIDLYNYRPSKSKSLESLIWTVLFESDTVGMVDEKTGQLIFDSRNPASIVLECRLDSPCGSIAFGTSNPSDYFLLIETSNKGVDSSTNCDFTMRFIIHLISIGLNPRSHISIMLVTLGILVFCIGIYYHLTDGSGKEWLRKIFHSKVHDKPPSAPAIHKLPKNSISSLAGHHLAINTKRAGILAQSLYVDPSTMRKSMARLSELHVERSSKAFASMQDMRVAHKMDSNYKARDTASSQRIRESGLAALRLPLTTTFASHSGSNVPLVKISTADANYNETFKEEDS